MPTRTQARRTPRRSVFLAGLAFLLLLTTTPALAAQRDGTVLFFSWEDLTQVLAASTPSDLSPSFLWRDPQPLAYQESPIVRSYRWGHGLGIDGYAHPGARMPLWGY